jgi:hypothetical protein
MPRGSKNLACSQRECRVDLSDSASRLPGCRHSEEFDGPARPVEPSCCQCFRAHFYGTVARAPRRVGLLGIAGIVLFLTIPAFESARAGDTDKSAALLGQKALDGESASSPRDAGPSSVAVQDADRFSLQSHSVSVFPEAMPARVLIRYLAGDSEAARRAHDLAKALIAEGIEVSDVRDSVAAVRTELRFLYVPDQAAAQMVGRLAAVMPVRFAFAEDDLMPRPGTIQLTVSGR